MRKMRDSGVEWIGQIPVDWKLSKIKHHFSISSGTTPKSDEPQYWDGDIVWITPADFKTDDVFVSKGHRNLSQEGYRVSSLQLVPAGSIIFSKRAPIGQVVINAIDLCTNQGCLTAVLNDDSNVRFYRYVMSIATEEFELAGSGTTFKEISATRFENILLPLTSKQEQTKCADYLDSKCSKIDVIIEKQQAIIEKLKEYKLSVIIEAVTKGLNPNVEMKDSGVEWIGQMPTSWDCTTVGMIATVVRGASPRPAGDPLYFNGKDVPWITVAEVTKGEGKYIDGTETFLTFEGAKQSRIVEEGTLLLSNSGATLGVPKITRIRGCINDGSVAFYNLCINQEFLLYLFKGRTFELRKQMQGYGQPNLNTTIVKKIEVPLPTEPEQKAIVDFLDQKCIAVEKTIKDREKVIEKLQEYKKSLIYEVVTGKKEV